MFGNGKLEEFKRKQRIAVVKYIQETLKEQTTQAELMYSYGVIDMAYEAEIISMNERANFKIIASNKENQRRKAASNEIN